MAVLELGSNDTGVLFAFKSQKYTRWFKIIFQNI
jgi:hypothetical protein